MTDLISERVAIVLVEPQSPGNVGMVCRAMKNMGLADLRLVNPCDITDDEALKFAVSARTLLETARIFPNLADALADTPLSVATTRRAGKYRQELLTPSEAVRVIGQDIGANRAAFVFGREDHGLTTDELACCRYQATIPSNPDCGSLNLAQAVLIFCYELAGSTLASVPVTRQLAGVPEHEDFFGQLERTLVRIGFLNPQNPGHIMKSLRRIYQRAQLDSREVAILRGMLTQIDWAKNEFKGKK
jgi:tRNA/rRNA methyltransferase